MRTALATSLTLLFSFLLFSAAEPGRGRGAGDHRQRGEPQRGSEPGAGEELLPEEERHLAERREGAAGRPRGRQPGAQGDARQGARPSSDELKRYWIERQYANADQPPASVADDASVLKFVSFFKGGIGFVSKSALAGATGVKPVLTLSF